MKLGGFSPVAEIRVEPANLGARIIAPSRVIDTLARDVERKIPRLFSVLEGSEPAAIAAENFGEMLLSIVSLKSVMIAY